MKPIVLIVLGAAAIMLFFTRKQNHHTSIIPAEKKNGFIKPPVVAKYTEAGMQACTFAIQMQW